MLFKPNRKLDLKKYMLWSDSVHLTNVSCFIHGTFNFDSRSDVISAKQFVDLCHWEYLLISCITLGIVPPLFPLLLQQNQGKEEEISNMSPVILLACIYTDFVSLVLIIVISSALAPVLSLVLSPVLDPVLSLVYYLPKFLKYVKYNEII